MRWFTLFAVGLAPGCAYRIGSGLTAGVLDEAQGKGKSEGIEGTAEELIERALLVELGHQLGQGLTSGAADIDPEQKARLEQTIDDLITVAARRAGKGLRDEVSPELREMVQKDIVRALSEGLRGELGASLEDTVDRVIAKAVASLRVNLGDEETRMAISDVIRDSVYFAMREDMATPGIGSTLEATLTENMLAPIDQTFRNLTSAVELSVDERARRTENTLKGIISVLVLFSGVIAMLYFIRNRQVRRLEERNQTAERGLKNVDAALDHLDEGTRAAVVAKLVEYESVTKRPPHKTPLGAPPRKDPPKRSDDYERRR